MNSKEFGKLGEELAAAYLARRGYRILVKNFRCRFGEVDIVAKKGTVICFAEVKARKSAAFGRPSESVNAQKRKKLQRAAQYYLEKEKIQDKDVSIDVIELICDDRRFCINHLVNAVTE